MPTVIHTSIYKRRSRSGDVRSLTYREELEKNVFREKWKIWNARPVINSRVNCEGNKAGRVSHSSIVLSPILTPPHPPSLFQYNKTRTGQLIQLIMKFYRQIILEDRAMCSPSPKFFPFAGSECYHLTKMNVIIVVIGLLTRLRVFAFSPLTSFFLFIKNK